MNAITLINVALHVLLLSAVGWGMVRWCIPDARHRAWASLLVLFVALIAPLFMEIRGEVPVSATEEAPVTPVSSWKPDWKISTSVTPPVRSIPETVTEPPATPVWSLTDVAWWTCVIWIAGTVAVALLLSVLSLAAWRWRRSLRSPTVTEMDLLPSSASRYALRVSEREGCPCVVGLWQPVIAVPRQIIGKWSSRQWTWLLRHEGEHIRNRDTLTAWLLGWTKALVWWNPFVHALAEQWSQAREEICDMAAVWGERDPAAYSGFLLDIAAGNRASSPVLLHMAASRPARRLRARMVAMLAQRRVREKTSRVFQFGALVIMVSIAAIVSCVGLKAEDAPAKKIPKTENPPSNDSTEMFTRAFKVAPDFLSSGKPVPQDPISGGQAPVAKRITALEFLTQRGIAFPEGATASFVPATSQLIVRNTQANIARIESELGAIKDEQEFRNTHQVYVTTKWVELDAAQVHGRADGQGAANSFASLMASLPDILTDPQFQVVIRTLAQTKGVNLMTAPSVTTRIGQRATVEAIRDFYGKEAAEAAAKGLTVPAPDFIGTRNEIHVEFDGHLLKIQVAGDLGELDKTDPASPRVLHLRQSRTASIRDGETLYLEMGESPTNKGRLVLLFVTANLIEPRGQPLGVDEAAQRAKKAETMKEGAASAANPPQEVKFVTGPKQFAEGDDIVIDKVMCSSNEFKVGDKVVVQGHYRLTSIPEAQLALYLTHWKGGGREKSQPTQYGDVKSGSGSFERAYTIQTEGSLHLSFYDMSKLKPIGGMYFGTRQQVDHVTRSASAPVSPPEEESRPVTVSIWMADVMQRKDQDLSQVLFDSMPDLAVPARDEKGSSITDTVKQATLPPGSFIVCGVLSTKQHDAVRSALQRRKHTTLTSFPEITGRDLAPAIAKQVGTNFTIEVSPACSVDGPEVDLEIRIAPGAFAPSSRALTTSLTAWDGNTVVMGGALTVDGDSRMSRLVFITTEIQK